jgi:hypothetical protein
MKLVYTHPNLAVLAQVLALIERADIACVVRNEYASGALGEIAPINAWPEVWVINDRDFERSTLIVEQLQQAIEAPDWQCSECDNFSPATFDTCWQCGHDRA